MAFLFRENGWHGTDGQTNGRTDGRGAKPNAAPMGELDNTLHIRYVFARINI